MDRPEIIGCLDLRCRMAVKSHLRIFRIHADPVILHRQTPDAAFFNHDENALCTCVDGVFHQFLHNAHRSFYNFAGCAHIRCLRIKLSDSAHIHPALWKTELNALLRKSFFCFR